jgi:hypothetical protein
VRVVVANALHLPAAELDALRCLQTGAGAARAGDPVWDGLLALRLVEPLGRGELGLTIRGRMYRTD